MRILNLFNMYFLAMMLVQGSVVIILDSRNFEKSDMDNTGKKARTLGWLAIIITMILFILRCIL